MANAFIFFNQLVLVWPMVDIQESCWCCFDVAWIVAVVDLQESFEFASSLASSLVAVAGKDNTETVDVEAEVDNSTSFDSWDTAKAASELELQVFEYDLYLVQDCLDCNP